MSKVPDPASGGKKALYAEKGNKPTFAAPVWDAIPAALKTLVCWVVWSLVWKPNANGDGKWDKVPKTVKGTNAKPNDPNTWATFDTAKDAYTRGRFDGIGFVFAAADRLTGIDLDNVRNPTTGELVPWAEALVGEANTYTEVSPSGTGVKLFGRGTWAGDRHKRPHPSGVGEVEVYSDRRFFTLTGEAISGTPGEVNDVQPLLDALAGMFTAGKPTPPPPAPPTGGRQLEDAQLLTKARAAANGDKFRRLWDGDTSGHDNDPSSADLALCGLLAYWCNGDRERMERLFTQSALGQRAKWRDRADYRKRTIDRALAGKSEFYTPAGTATSAATATGGSPSSAWPDPVPFAPNFDPPAFPVDVLPVWVNAFAVALAEEKQVPVDLPALLILGAVAAGLGRKVTVTPWPGWNREPVNLFVLCALPPGERKSQTFAAVFAPVAALEVELRTQADPQVREAESALRVAQKRVDHLEGQIAKRDDPNERAALRDELRVAREELATVRVPVLPVLRVDDDTPEMMAKELVLQGGRLLAASPEARTLENIDRYSDKPNFDVFLKGHAGDDIRSGRIGRGRDSVDRPALTCVYSPQPCVVEALGETPEMRGRGFLARWVFALPASVVGYRKTRGEEVPPAVKVEYDTALTLAWLTHYADPETEAPHDLRFSAEAAAEFDAFEKWKEAELRAGGLLAGAGGWGNKLGGLCVRLCGLFHVADGLRKGDGWQTSAIAVEVVRRAVKLCREYAVPHALAAFQLMGDSPAVAGAKAVSRWLQGRDTPTAPFSKRDAFNGCRGRFGTVDDMQPALDLLERHFLLRPQPDPNDRRRPGRPPSPVYEVNPAAFREPTAAQNTHKPHNCGREPSAGSSADTANSARR